MEEGVTGQSLFGTVNEGRWHSLLSAIQRREANSQHAELIFGLESVPGGELQRHRHRRLDVFVELGEQLGFCESLELCSRANVTHEHTATLGGNSDTQQDDRSNKVWTHCSMLATVTFSPLRSLTVM